MYDTSMFNLFVRKVLFYFLQAVWQESKCCLMVCSEARDDMLQRNADLNLLVLLKLGCF